MSVLKNVSKSLVYQVVLTSLQLAIVVLFTRWLGATGRGHLAIFNGAIEIATMVCGLGLSSAIVYYISSKQVATIDIIKGIFKLLGFAIVALFILSFLLYALKLQYLITPFSSVFFALFFFIAITIGNIIFLLFSAICNAHNEFSVPILLKCFQLAVILVAVYYFSTEYRFTTFSISDNFFYYLLIVVPTYFFINALLIVYTFRHFGKEKAINVSTVKNNNSVSILKTLLPFGFMAFACNSTQLLNVRMDLWFVQQWCSSSDLGVYSIAALCIQMLWLMPSQIATVFYTKWSAQMDHNQRIEQVAQTTGLLFVLTLITYIIGLVFAYIAIPFVFGKDFVQSAPILAILLLGGIPIAASMLISAYNASQNQLRVNLKSSLLGLTVSIVLYPLLIKTNGIIGAAVASSISYCVTAVYLLWQFKYSSQHLSWQTFTSIQNSALWQRIFKR